MRQGSTIMVFDLDGGGQPRGAPWGALARELEDESPARFTYDDVHPMVVALLDTNQMDRALDEAIRHGDSNTSHLADLIFFKMYPGREGRFISRDEPDYRALSQTWLGIHDDLVPAALARVRQAPAPSRAPCYQEPARAAGIRRVWTFYPVPTNPANFYKFVAKMGLRGITDIALEINDKNAKAFELAAAKVRALQSMAPELCHGGIDLHLMCWLRPDAQYLQQAAQALRPLCQSLPVRSVLFDVEEPWTQNTNEAAAAALLKTAWPFSNWPCLLGATSTTYLPASVRPVAQRCDYVLPQAYSENKEGRVYLAGQTQRTAYDQWKGLGKPMVMGLAAYNLNLNPPPTKGAVNPPRRLTEKGALQLAIVAAERTGAKEVAYWSLDHLLKPGAEQRADFVREAARKARAGLSQAATS